MTEGQVTVEEVQQLLGEKDIAIFALVKQLKAALSREAAALARIAELEKQ